MPLNSVYPYLLRPVTHVVVMRLDKICIDCRQCCHLSNETEYEYKSVQFAIYSQNR